MWKLQLRKPISSTNTYVMEIPQWFPVNKKDAKKYLSSSSNFPTKTKLKKY